MTQTTTDMEQRARTALYRTWQYVGEDFDPEWSLDDAIEIVLDADRLEDHGKDPEAVKWFRTLPDDQQEKMTRETIQGRC